MPYILRTKPATATTWELNTRVALSGYVLTAEFFNRRTGAILLSTEATGAGTTVTVSLSASQVETIGNALFRIKAVKDAQTSYVQNGSVIYTQPVDDNDQPEPSPLIVPMNMSFGAVSWASMPAALTELNGSTRSRIKVDLSRYTDVRITVSVSTVGFSGSEYRLQYATDGDTQANWAYLDVASGPQVPITFSGGVSSGWSPIAEAARREVWLRVVGIGGNGTISPIVGNVAAHFAHRSEPFYRQILDRPLGWLFPANVAVSYLPSGAFGAPRENGTRSHRGLDLHVPIGTPVYSLTAGTIHSFMPGWDGVITPGNGLGYGVQVNNRGVRYTYGHFGPQQQNAQAQAFAPGIEPGATVTRGQLLGWSGESGATASGPHLHIDWRDTRGIVLDDPTADYQAALGSENAARYDPAKTIAMLASQV